MYDGRWMKELPVAITVCDAEGTIVEMNERACKMFEKDGGRNLIGGNVLHCHPERARNKIREMFAARSVNCYTIEKNGVKKMVYQVPWYKDGEYAGFVELVMEVPFELPHYKR
ncbi:MAG: PAS domain-containing protein [Peptococcaceae bacterium]|nr:PAS domain-containing protein [Peptococcaceae bacterium]